jgi:hypothetical protein
MSGNPRSELLTVGRFPYSAGIVKVSYNVFMDSLVMRVCESFVRGHVYTSELGDLYIKFNPIEDVTEFMRRAQKLFPSLNCGLASVYLKHTLGFGEVVCGEYSGQRHTFLMIGQLIVDITADQYGGPELYIGPLVEPWSV